MREAERKASVNTFGAVAEEWLENNQKKWVATHAKVTRQRLDRNILPWLGSRPIEDITPPDILEILRRIEARGAYETARRCLSICSQIFDFAQATGRCSRDPCPLPAGAWWPPANTRPATLPPAGQRKLPDSEPLWMKSYPHRR
ncbi:tyrosine-type recombinase/integrase [Synechococcus sp. H65.1]|uniref:tyrosine-type recombinase/integrase n=1 Tax=unclassified Synechococcus TaxID=2626047 RepID=UPI0039C0A1EA